MISVDLNRIQDFLRIVELGNITRAAEATGERKAKLSRNLALLEKELGVQLVYRTTRQFNLTEEGTQFYRQMKQYFMALESAIAHLTARDEAIEGKIRITAPEDIGNHIVSDIVSEFSKANPGISFDIIYTNQVLDLVKLGVDVAFRVGPLRDSSILQKKVGLIDFVLAASPGYLEKALVLSQLDDLERHSTIGFFGSGKLSWTMHSQGTKRSLSINPRVVANNYLTIRDLTIRGLGVSFLPRFLAQPYLDSGELVHVLRQWRNEGVTLHLVMPGQKNVAERIRRFFDYSAKRLTEIL